MAQLTPEEKEFVTTMAQGLPPVIARKYVEHFLGGIVAQQTLNNADNAGEGPEEVFMVGRNIAYKTESLLEWTVRRLGVQKVEHINKLRMRPSETRKAKKAARAERRQAKSVTISPEAV